MLDLNVASDDIKSMLYAFRHFYSSALRLNIVMKADDWKLSEAVKDSDILGLLKKNISSLKEKYSIYNDDKVKVDYAVDKFNELYKLSYDFNSSFEKAFSIAIKTCKMLDETRNFLVLKWFVVSFFEKYLPAVSKAFDIYKRGVTCVILDLSNKIDTMSDFANEIIKDADINYLVSEYFCLTQYIKNLVTSFDQEHILTNEDLKYLYKTYLKCKDNTIRFNLMEFDRIFDSISAGYDEPGDYKINYMNKVINDVLKDSEGVNDTTKLNMVDTLSDVRITGELPFENTTYNRTRFINIIMQTASVIQENEGKHSVMFTIDDDFKMYFVVNKEEYHPVFIKRYNDTLTVINYEGSLYLLYHKCDFTNNVYGVTLVNWFDEPNKIIKISPDSEGKYVFSID